MARSRRPITFPALAAAALFAGGLALAPFAASQDAPPERDSKIGTREQKTMDVDWGALQREAPFGLSETAEPVVAGVPREKLRETRLPILLPRNKSMVARMRLLPERDRYVASLRDDDISVQIMGTRISQGALKSKGAADRMKQMSDEEGYVYQRTEYGCELSFMRYNASYNISVECRKPDTDERCTKKDYIMQLAKSLVYVGGMPGEGEHH